jgi:15-cis-phytoene synthase
MLPLDESVRYCRGVARRRARNFYYAFVLLSREQRDAMCAIYAFMRYCDDLSDDPGAARDPIERWRAALDQALAGRYDGHPVWPAFHAAVRTYGIPQQYFHAMIEGVASDLEPRRIQTFDELYRYCYHVASVVGLTTIHVFGFDSPAAPALAEKCGVAFQLTNILRDIREDAGRDRIYLPAEDLARFGVTEDELKAGTRTAGLIELMRFETDRARAYYRESMPLVGMVHPRSRKSLWALIEIYSRLLERIRECDYDVFSRRISLSGLEKSGIVARAALPWRNPARSPSAFFL